MLRFVIPTPPTTEASALWVVISPQNRLRCTTARWLPRACRAAEPVARQWRVAPYEAPLLRCAISTGGAAASWRWPTLRKRSITSCSGAVAYDGNWKGEAHTITLAAPFVSLADEKDWQKAAGLDFEAKLAERGELLARVRPGRRADGRAGHHSE